MHVKELVGPCLLIEILNRNQAIFFFAVVWSFVIFDSQSECDCVRVCVRERTEFWVCNKTKNMSNSLFLSHRIFDPHGSWFISHRYKMSTPLLLTALSLNADFSQPNKTSEVKKENERTNEKEHTTKRTSSYSSNFQPHRTMGQ